MYISKVINNIIRVIKRLEEKDYFISSKDNFQLEVFDTNDR